MTAARHPRYSSRVKSTYLRAAEMVDTHEKCSKRHHGFERLRECETLTAIRLTRW